MSAYLPTLVTLVAAAVSPAGQSAWAAGPTAPGEQGASLLYALTHLPFAAYLILFFIFLLAAANLVYQARMFPSTQPFLAIWALLVGKDRRTEGGWSVAGMKSPGTRLGRAHAPTSVSSAKELASDGILAVRKVAERQDASSLSIPTPLEGINHRLPQLSTHGEAAAAALGAVEAKVSQEAPVTEFKFSSAVDLPSQEELERREKGQLAVSGTVLDAVGEGIDSVVVYLTDEQGTRIGQSCRSAAGTGEFKVLVNEPGRYTLRAYKRGLILDGGEPEPLPIEAGKIEGYAIRMIPEGSQVHGKVINQTATPLPSECEIRLHVRGQDVVRSVFTDSAYGFRINGVPHHAECRLEVIDTAGRTFAVSPWFETRDKKEIAMNIRVAAQTMPAEEESDAASDEGLVQDLEDGPAMRRAGSSDQPA